MGKVQFPVETQPTRSDVFFFDPNDIHVSLNEFEGNGRWGVPDPKRVESLCKSFDEHGQLQPVRVRKLPNEIRLIGGHHRLLAARLYNERHPDKPMKLQARVVTCNEQEAFLEMIIENNERNATTPMDDAINQRVLMDKFGMTTTEVAKLYNCPVSRISQLKSLLSLDHSTRLKVHSGELTLQAALLLASLSEKEQESILAEGTTSQEVVSAVKEKKRKEKQNGGKVSKSVTRRTVKEVATVFEKLCEHEDNCVSYVAEVILQFVDGGTEEKDVASLLQTAISGKAPFGVAAA